MQVLRHFPSILAQPCALAIGNFDGLHLGHQALLAKLTETAKQQQLKSAVMTFEPHPREFFTPEQAPTRLASLREKLEDRKSTRLNSSHSQQSRMPSSA